MNNEHFSDLERLAASSVITTVGGLFLIRAASHSLDRSIVFWIALSLLAGVVLSTGKPKSLKLMAKRATLPASFFPLAFVGYMLVRMTIDWLKSPGGRFLPSLHVSAAVDTIRFSALEFALGVSFLFLISFFASLLIIVLSSLCSRMILQGAVGMYKLGPEGMDRLSKLVLAVSGLVAAIIVVWTTIDSGQPLECS